MAGVVLIASIESIVITITVALLALIGTVAAGAFVVWGQLRTTEMSSKAQAEAVLSRYTAPLLGAAFELQARLYNILKLDFLPKFYVDGEEWQKTYALENTLFVIGQYFGWREILRREIQFLSFADSEQTRAVAHCLGAVTDLFQDSSRPELGQPFLIWRGEQRAIGERMMVIGTDRVDCLGYADFVENRQPEFLRWFERISNDLTAIVKEPNARLLEVQHALVDLIQQLDPQGLHYPADNLTKA
jgi:hypothetical protein